MGAERWLDFGRKEVSDKVRAYLGECEDVRVGDMDGVWFEWKGRNKLEVWYSFGGLSNEVATLVCRELVKRFKVKKIGADSVGWYTDDWSGDVGPELRARYEGAVSWVDWQEKYRVDWSPLVTMAVKYGRVEELKEYLEELRPLDVAVTAWFAARDEAVGYVRSAAAQEK